MTIPELRALLLPPWYLRLRLTRERREILIQFYSRKHYNERAYIVVGLRGPQAEVEFPSDWGEEHRAWVRLGFGLVKFAFSFPWSRVVPDEHQCSGPTYGFVFFEDGLHLHWGKCRGKRDDPMKIIGMPWRWRHIDRAHKRLTGKESHPYTYTLRSGETQRATATVYSEARAWWRPWPPFYKPRRSLWVEFDTELGERAGSWKGGVLGCGYDMKRGETPLATLRRMERERRFT